MRYKTLARVAKVRRSLHAATPESRDPWSNFPGAARADDACPAGQSPVPKMDRSDRKGSLSSAFLLHPPACLFCGDEAALDVNSCPGGNLELRRCTLSVDAGVTLLI